MREFSYKTAARGLIECPEASRLAKELMQENAEFARFFAKAVCSRTSPSGQCDCLHQGDGAVCGTRHGVARNDGGLHPVVVAVRLVVQDALLRTSHRGTGECRHEEQCPGASEPARPASRNLHP